MKLKVSEINELKEAIQGLEGIAKIAKVSLNGETIDKIVVEPFKLSGKVRWNLAKNLSILSNRMDGYDKVRGDIIAQISGGSGIIKETEVERMAEYTKQMREVLSQEQDVDGILKLKESDLNLEENQIPLAVLSSLQPILE